MLIKKWIFYDSDEIEIRLTCYRSFSTFFISYRSFCSSTWGKGWLEVICVVKSKVIQTIQTQHKYKTTHFQNIMRKRLLRDIHWNQKQISISKCYLGSLKDKKMYSLGTIANSKRPPAKINENGAFAKVTNLVE